MNVGDIIEKYLIDNGYAGLLNGDQECACPSGQPCEQLQTSCEPGVEVPCDGEGCDMDGDDHFHLAPRVSVAKSGAADAATMKEA